MPKCDFSGATALSICWHLDRKYTKNDQFTDIFIDFIKIYGIPTAPCDINATREPQDKLSKLLESLLSERRF